MLYLHRSNITSQISWCFVHTVKLNQVQQEEDKHRQGKVAKHSKLSTFSQILGILHNQNPEYILYNKLWVQKDQRSKLISFRCVFIIHIHEWHWCSQLNWTLCFLLKTERDTADGLAFGSSLRHWGTTKETFPGRDSGLSLTEPSEQVGCADSDKDIQKDVL